MSFANESKLTLLASQVFTVFGNTRAFLNIISKHTIILSIFTTTIIVHSICSVLCLSCNIRCPWLRVSCWAYHSDTCNRRGHVLCRCNAIKIPLAGNQKVSPSFSPQCFPFTTKHVLLQSRNSRCHSAPLLQPAPTWPVQRKINLLPKLEVGTFPRTGDCPV